MKQIPLGFVPEPLLVPLAQLFPSRKTPQAIQSSRKFKQIKASVGEVGLIEPLTIIQPDKKQPRYLILDGHIRLVALQDLGFADAPCLMALSSWASLSVPRPITLVGSMRSPVKRMSIPAAASASAPPCCGA